MRSRNVRRFIALAGAAFALGACIRDPAVGHEGETDAAAAPGADAAARRPDAGGGAVRDAASPDARSPSRPPDAQVVAADAAHAPDAFGRGDARAPAPDAGVPDIGSRDAGSPDTAFPDAGGAPLDCRALLELIGRGGGPCDVNEFRGCNVPFGAGCCAHEVYCDAGRLAEGIFCEDDCDQACHANPDAANCALQPGCTWFVGGCDPPAEGFVTGPACIGTPGAACEVDADCPLGTHCLSYWIDPCADDVCDACGGTTRQCGTDAVPGGVVPPSPCEAALDHVMGCFDHPTPPAARGVAWPACSPADQCAAECALALDCRELACNFDGDIDCDGVGAWGVCVEENCRGGVCPEDCALTSPSWDCCHEAWTCGATCDLDCVVPEPVTPQVCRCVGEMCRAVDAP